MSFLSLLKENKKTNEQYVEKIVEKYEEDISEEKKKPEEILRGAGIKIKLVTPTTFGTQIDLPKKYDESELKKLLNGYNIKIKGNSIFVVES